MRRGLWVAGLLVLWEGATRTGVLPAAFFPPPTEVAAALGREIRAGEVARHVAITLSVYLRGLALALSVGVPLGMLLGRVWILRRASAVLVEMLRPIPSVAIIPVAILVLGIGDAMRIAVSCYAAAWPVLLNTLYGVYNVDPVWVDNARLFRLTRWEVFWRVVFPGALPFVATGVRLGSAVTLIVAVTAEMVAGGSGLGFYVKAAELAGRVPEMYAGIVVLGAVGYLLNLVLRVAESRALWWYQGAMGRAVGGRHS